MLRPRPAAALLVICCALSSSAAAATSAASPPATKPTIPSVVLRDCLWHAGGMVHKHTLVALRRALITMPLDVDEYTTCRVQIESQVAAYTGNPGQAKSDAVVDDCTTHGALTHSFPVSVLRQARRNLRIDIADYTACSQVITSQLSALR